MSDLVKTGRVCVDWDGTLVDDNRWPEMGDWLPGAPEAIHALAGRFDEVVIWTCRTAPVDLNEETARDPWPQIRAIHKMLDDIDAPSNVAVWRAPYKPPAAYYIDNRAIRFNGSWSTTLAAVTGSQDDLCPPVLLTQTADSIRTFETGATRNNDHDQLDYEGFVSPLALRVFAEYMHEHRFQSDGTLRASDNWQKGIPIDSYMKSLLRHVIDLWLIHRGFAPLSRETDKKKALAAILFNAQGYLHEEMLGEIG